MVRDLFYFMGIEFDSNPRNATMLNLLKRYLTTLVVLFTMVLSADLMLITAIVAVNRDYKKYKHKISDKTHHGIK